MGLKMVAPVIMHYGTAEQRAHYLPRILSGEDYWCQGFSEPGAGSDLAALQLRADRDGGDYVLNGSKIWTTHAHFANRMFRSEEHTSELQSLMRISSAVFCLKKKKKQNKTKRNI